MNWTKDQRKVIDTHNCNLLVSAAAGSGKTAVLVERIIQMVFDKDNPVDIDSLLVVTFTKAAAAQMKDKISSAIEKKIDEEPSDTYYLRQLNLLREADILTIDSFCYKVVKEYFHVISIDPKVQVAEEAELAVIKQEILDEVIEDFYKNNDAFIMFSNAFSSDKNDANIEDCIIKLYELSESYPFPGEWLNNAKSNLHVEDDEMLSSMHFMKKYIEEVHICAAEIKEVVLEYLEISQNENGPKHYKEALLADIQMLDDIISANTYGIFHDISICKFATLKRAKKSDVYDVDIAEKIKSGREIYKKKIKALLKIFDTPFDKVLEQYRLSEKMLSAYVDAVIEFSERYMEKKVSLGLVDFSDVEHFALQILCDGTDDDGNPIPSRIGKELSEKYNEILIDEYQDSNFLQENILRCVSKVPYGNNNIFMVGDVKQSIYGFRMARPELFTDKYNTYEPVRDSSIVTDENIGDNSQDDVRDNDNGDDNRNDIRHETHGIRSEVVSKDMGTSKELKIMLHNNFRSRENILDYINYIFYRVMTESVGGIAYTDDEALNAGRVYIENEQDSVELLIGESKDFDFVNDDDTDNTDDNANTVNTDHIGYGNIDVNKTSEDDGETDSDVSGMELEAGIVADRIEELMGRNGEKTQLVVDEVTGELRPVEYRDIVILFRSPKRYQPVFSEILMKRNIPVKLQNENGYFDMVEIRSLITLLKMIDNPFNDVECAALLRGYFGKLDSNELAVVMLMKRYAGEHDYKHINTEYLFSFIESVVKNEEEFRDIFHAVMDDKYIGDIEDKAEIDKELNDKGYYSEEELWNELYCDNLMAKCIKAAGCVEHFQKKKRMCSITELIEAIYYDTDYYYYVEAMPQGKERGRNLTLFMDETKKFERGRTRTLFDFLRFVKRISEKEISLGGDPVVESPDNMVRIMSIHKSKGLEFPVVFVSGIGKKFNIVDTNQSLILHSDYYICAKYINPEKRCGNDTFMRRAVSALMKKEIIEEELRVLYVALTRAKEKLILTGVTPDIVKLVNKLLQAADSENIVLPHSMITSFGSYLEIIVAASMRNPEFYNAMKNVKARYNNSGEIVSARYDVKSFIDNPHVRTDVRVFYYRDLIASQLSRGENMGLQRADNIERLINTNGVIFETLKKNLEWRYIDEALTTQKSKMSVSEIKRLYQKNDDEVADENDRNSFYPERTYKEILPRFIAGDKPMDASLKGTWFHKAMELIDNKKLSETDDVRRELDNLFTSGRLPEKTREFITEDKIYAFINSDLGKRMHKASLADKLYKERKFVVGFPVIEGAPDVVVQGIIDAYFEEDGKLILLDYKTDRIKEGQEDVLVKRYTTQLDYYKRTLEKITGMEVAETYLYSFSLDKEIKM